MLAKPTVDDMRAVYQMVEPYLEARNLTMNNKELTICALVPTNLMGTRHKSDVGKISQVSYLYKL